MPPQFSYHNKGFINYVFCRNWAVRNPAGTRLDSSLVNKQVAFTGAFIEGVHWTFTEVNTGAFTYTGKTTGAFTGALTASFTREFPGAFTNKII